MWQLLKVLRDEPDAAEVPDAVRALLVVRLIHALAHHFAPFVVAFLYDRLHEQKPKQRSFHTPLRMGTHWTPHYSQYNSEAAIQGEMGYAVDDLLFSYRIGILDQCRRNGRVCWEEVSHYSTRHRIQPCCAVQLNAHALLCMYA